MGGAPPTLAPPVPGVPALHVHNADLQVLRQVFQGCPELWVTEVSHHLGQVTALLRAHRPQVPTGVMPHVLAKQVQQGRPGETVVQAVGAPGERTHPLCGKLQRHGVGPLGAEQLQQAERPHCCELPVHPEPELSQPWQEHLAEKFTGLLTGPPVGRTGKLQGHAVGAQGQGAWAQQHAATRQLRLHTATGQSTHSRPAKRACATGGVAVPCTVPAEVWVRGGLVLEHPVEDVAHRVIGHKGHQESPQSLWVRPLAPRVLQTPALHNNEICLTPRA